MFASITLKRITKKTTAPAGRHRVRMPVAAA